MIGHPDLCRGAGTPVGTLRCPWHTGLLPLPHDASGGLTHQSSSTTRTSTKNVFLLTRFLKVSAKGENFSYVECGLKTQPFSWGRDGGHKREGSLPPATLS